MWTFLVAGYALVLLSLIGAAGWVALFVAEPRRSARATSVLRTLVWATVGSGGLLALLTRP